MEKKLNKTKINQSVCFPKRTWKAIKVLFKKYRTHQYGDHTHIYLSSKWRVQIYCRRVSVFENPNGPAQTDPGSNRRHLTWRGFEESDSWLYLHLLNSFQCGSKTSGLLTGALPAAQCFRFLLGCADIHVCEEMLMLDTIFWIFSSFFRMLDLTAQILSCWSLINCSSSVSSDFRGSTTLSVILRYRRETA